MSFTDPLNFGGVLPATVGDPVGISSPDSRRYRSCGFEVSEYATYRDLRFGRSFLWANQGCSLDFLDVDFLPVDAMVGTPVDTPQCVARKRDRRQITLRQGE
jgi:hypothetical protein